MIALIAWCEYYACKAVEDAAWAKYQQAITQSAQLRFERMEDHWDEIAALGEWERCHNATTHAFESAGAEEQLAGDNPIAHTENAQLIAAFAGAMYAAVGLDYITNL